MTTNPIRFRIGSEYAGSQETGEFTDSSFAEAVAALQGDHSEEYHRDTPVFVLRVHAETHTVEGDGKRTRTVTYQKGQPVFGERVTLYGRRPSFGTVMKDAEVSWGSGGSISTTEAREQLALMTLATELAEAANAEPPCAKCLAQIAEMEAKFS